MTEFLSYARYSAPPETPTLSEKGQENLFLGPLHTMRENLTESLDDLKSRLIFDDELEHLRAMRSCLQEGISWIAELLGDNDRPASDEDARAQTPDRVTGKHTSLPVPAVTPPAHTPTEPNTITTTTDAMPPAPQPSTRVPNAMPKPPHMHQPQNSRLRPHLLQQAQTSKPPSTRLVVRFTGSMTALTTRPHPSVFRDELNEVTRIRAIESIEYSRAGQLILRAAAPHTAADLAALSDQIWPVIRASLQMDDNTEKPSFEPDDTWMRLVIHNTPVPIWDGKKDLRTTQKDMREEICRANSLPAHSVAQFRWLCSEKDAEERTRLSSATSPTTTTIMMALHVGSTAALLRKHGAVAFGAHCNVSTYRPRHRLATSRRDHTTRQEL